jgi:prepilin-type N-terminal cleavage/methylation domain-containing protein
MKSKKNDRGFTLIEIITSVVVISIIAVIVGTGFVQITNGYIMSKKNSTVAQQGQIATARIKKELASSKSITCGSANMVTYKDSSEEDSTIYWASGSNPLRLKTNSDCLSCAGICTGGDILVENIVLSDDPQKQYIFRYCKNPTDCSVNYGSSGYTSATVTSIEVTLLMKGYEDTKIKIAYPDFVVLNLEAGS